MEILIRNYVYIKVQIDNNEVDATYLISMKNVVLNFKIPFMYFILYYLYHFNSILFYFISLYLI